MASAGGLATAPAPASVAAVTTGAGSTQQSAVSAQKQQQQQQQSSSVHGSNVPSSSTMALLQPSMPNGTTHTRPRKVLAALPSGRSLSTVNTALGSDGGSTTGDGSVRTTDVLGSGSSWADDYDSDVEEAKAAAMSLAAYVPLPVRRHPPLPKQQQHHLQVGLTALLQRVCVCVVRSSSITQTTGDRWSTL